MVNLRIHERQTLLSIKRLGGKATVKQIQSDSGLPEAAIMRGVLTLQEKKLVSLREYTYQILKLKNEGRTYARKGLPERRIMNLLVNTNFELPVSEISQQTDVTSEKISVMLGWLIRKKWATIDQDRNVIKVLAPRSLPQPGNDEKLLKLVDNNEPVVAQDLSSELKAAISILKRRKLLQVDEKTERTIQLTPAGRMALKKGLPESEEITQLTPDLIITKNWQKVKFTPFDVTAPGPKVYPAKTHPVQQIIQQIKEIFIEMGFTEIRGPIIETAFWNFDALFQPQDHPAREMHDTFYLEHPKMGKLPQKSIVEKVAKTHENGWITGSRGWRYSWSSKEAQKLIFRTHSTAATIRYLADHHEPPIKVFSVDRVYRNEKMDYKSLVEFHQIEGIIMDEKVTFRDLIGTLKEFYKKLGLEKVRFWPSYFPYTEPSAQSTVYIPEFKKWFELCGMGIFRPEVLQPLNVKHPVLAWGGGLERLIMLRLGVDDIRFLYKNDLGWIRRNPICQY